MVTNETRINMMTNTFAFVKKYFFLFKLDAACSPPPPPYGLNMETDVLNNKST